jgi:hypothetical protein
MAFGDMYDVGVLSYDQVSPIQNQFDITNLTGGNGSPITSFLTFSITDLVVDFTSGPSLILPGSDFTIVDPDDDLDCTAAACNLFGESITDATLTGTLSPTTALSGLTPPDTGIQASFTTTLLPSTPPTLTAGVDATLISATGTSSTSATPEPETYSIFMIGVALIGLRFRWLRGNSH